MAGNYDDYTGEWNFDHDWDKHYPDREEEEAQEEYEADRRRQIEEGTWDYNDDDK